MSVFKLIQTAVFYIYKHELTICIIFLGNDVIFSPPLGSISFDQKVLINASILPDFILERNERFTLQLTSNDAKFFPFDSTQILIIDNEGKSL